MTPSYQLFDNRLKIHVPDMFFNTLAAARRSRRVYNRDAKDPVRFFVAPGPAHPRRK